jgi:hypothetical protein
MKIALPLLVLFVAAPVFAVPLPVSVVDAKGKPVVGADVQLESFGKTPRGIVLSQTNEQGVTTFDVEPMPHALYGNFAGRVFARKNGLALGSGQLNFKTPLRIELGPAAKIGGKVSDPEGKPIQGASISFLSAQKAGQEWDMLVEGPLLAPMTAHSAADGSWQLDGVPTDAQVYVSIMAPDRVRVRAQILAGTTTPTVLQAGAQIKGRLLGLDGKPLAGIFVSAQGTINSRDSLGASATTGEDGTFTLDGLNGGTFNVSFYSREEEKSFIIPAFESVGAAVGTPLQLPDARATEGVMIGGRVLETGTNAPINGASVGVYGGVNPASGAAVSSASTDENGVWKMRTLPGQSKVYLMGIPQEFKQDQQQRDMVIGEAGDVNLDFKLERLPKLSGRLLDENGNGIKTSLQLRHENQVFWANSDEKGDLTVYGPTNGDWDVTPQGTWELVGPARVTVVPDKPLEIRLRRAQLETLELGVYDDDDSAVEGQV